MSAVRYFASWSLGAVALCGWVACGGGPTAGGSTDVETGGVVGQLAQASDTSWAIGARVRLFALGLDTSALGVQGDLAVDSVWTDSLGRFAISKVPQGQYALEMYHPSHGTRGLNYVQVTDSSKDMGLQLLHTPAKVEVYWDSALQLESVWIEGLGRPLRPAQGQFRLLLDSIPAGVELKLKAKLQNSSSLWMRPLGPLLPKSETQIELKAE
jgi:hypothetical protein